MASEAHTQPATLRVERWLRQVEACARRPVEERVTELLAAVRAGAERYVAEDWDQANERHAEEFIASLEREFTGRVFLTARPRERETGTGPHPGDDTLAPESLPGDGDQPVVIVERQRLHPVARRTTGYNYIFTVPGERPERLILVAHYDTWRGPGADDNTTGEEITKQYLLSDLRATRRPPLTHTYILAGSEECGLIGFTSQMLLALGIGLANQALAKGVWALTLLGAALIPLAKYRFGVSGSREYVESLSPDELARIQSVISVDSVGEGRMYIPESSLGADFVRAFLPFPGYPALNDLLEEAAHLNGIKYNTFIAGGTTDHISFLEVNSGLRDRLGDWLGCPRWLGCHQHGKRKIPASALVCLMPGKASPLVFGGKIHTPADTPDRVYPGPLSEALRILDYWFYRMHGGPRLAEPRDFSEYHYAQLFRVTSAAGGQGEQYWLALKDAIEPNRRNLNGLYRVEAEVRGHRAVCRNPQILTWGVHTRLRHEVQDQIKNTGGNWKTVPVNDLQMETPSGTLHYSATGRGPLHGVEALLQESFGEFERFMGSNTFLTFFAIAFLLAKCVDVVLMNLFGRFAAFADWFFDWFAITLPMTVAAQLAVLLWLIGKKIPTMIDNAYRHLNKADNLRSLRRVA
ncbi:MAG TPA: M28 family peptidase [Terriglobales bacterium]|nr:M28 family peptidase [Terriglobales bacterium]